MCTFRLVQSQSERVQLTKRIHRPFRAGSSLAGLRKVELGFNRHTTLKSDIYRQAFQDQHNPTKENM